jgi:hypothetical protein
MVLLPSFVLTAWQQGWTYAPRTDPFCKVVRDNYQSRSEDWHAGRTPPVEPPPSIPAEVTSMCPCTPPPATAPPGGEAYEHDGAYGAAVDWQKSRTAPI